MFTIVVDAMGGDNAPQEIVRGACLAIKRDDIRIILVGQEVAIQKELSIIFPEGHSRIQIIHASEVIEMGEHPAQAFRKKKDASICVGLRLVKDKQADAFISAGNTGAVMTAATVILGKIQNIERPAIATILPTDHGRIIALDMGSNVDCRPSHLAQFAMMGVSFSKLILGIESPKVGLLNIGEEAEKGNALTLETFPLIQKLPIHFIGNIESKYILSGKADVIVCDGFVGNCLLKFGEGTFALFFNFLRKEFKSSLLSKIGLLFLMPALNRFKKRFDYEEIGGAPLLGVNGVAIISHGISNANAIRNAIFTAAQAVESKIVEHIEKEIGTTIGASVHA